MLWKNILLVALGGSLGSVARFLSHKYIGSLSSHPFPTGTLLVNIIGCLLIGVFYGLSVKQNYLTPELRLLLMTGFCGGFTTFSAFTLEGMNLLQQQRVFLFLLYFAASVFIGLGATFLGYWVTSKI
jgi:CrcB protein